MTGPPRSRSGMDQARRRAVALAPLLMAAAMAPALPGCESPTYEVRYELAVTPAVVESDAPVEGPRTADISADVTWTLTSHALEALVTNRADTTAAIIWDGATIAYDGGEPEPLINCSHCPGPDLPQAATEIPKRAQVALDTIPLSAGAWEWLPARAMGGSWRATEDIMGVSLSGGMSREDMQSAALETVGRKIRVHLPIRVGHRLLTHLYEIRIVGAEPYRTYH